jgi:uncharacterized membrane protein
LIITIVGWGLWTFFQKIGVPKVGAESYLLVDISIHLVIAMAYLTLTNKLQVPRSISVIYPIIGGASGVIGTIAFLTIVKDTPISIARSLSGLSILVTVLLGVFVLGETLTLKQYAGVSLAIISIFLLSG